MEDDENETIDSLNPVHSYNSQDELTGYAHGSSHSDGSHNIQEKQVSA